MKKNKSVPFESNPFKVIFNGFDRLFKHNQTMAIVLLFISALGTLWQFFNYGVNTGTTSTAGTSEAIAPEFVTLIVVAVTFVAVLGIFIAILVNGLMAFVAHKTARSETTTLSEAIGAVIDKFWVILWIQIIVFFKILGGILLFIVPGIRAAMRYNMVLLPVFDENATARQAIAKSKAITKDHLIEIFGMSVAAGIIPLIGQVMLVGGQSVMYPQLKELHASGGPKPKVHWLNYLAFILAGVFVLFILFVASIVLLVTSASS